MARTSRSLYRAIIDGTFDGALVEEGEPAPGLLHPRCEAETHLDHTGRERTRRAEVTVFSMATGADVDTGGGTQLFDVEGWFGHVGWRYFELPEGTVCPDNLVIRPVGGIRASRTGRLQGRLYAVEPLTRMSLESYRSALDNLARNAVVRKIELAK